MDQESMTAFVFFIYRHFLRKNPNSSSLALSDTLMGKTLNFYPAYPTCDHSSFQVQCEPIKSGCTYFLIIHREQLRDSFNQIKFSSNISDMRGSRMSNVETVGPTIVGSCHNLLLNMQKVLIFS